jgi:hypothetical protein
MRNNESVVVSNTVEVLGKNTSRYKSVCHYLLPRSFFLGLPVPFSGTGDNQIYFNNFEYIITLLYRTIN